MSAKSDAAQKAERQRKPENIGVDAPMKIDDLMIPETVITDVRAANKPQVLAELASRAAPLIHLEHVAVFRALLDRESFGSTGLGMGVAMPHSRFKGLRNPFALFARLGRAIDFHALDGRPVDLITTGMRL